MKVRMRGGKLIITIAVIDPPRPSKSGKRLLVATSRGVRRTSSRIGKKPVYVNANAFVRPDEHKGKKEAKSSKTKAVRKRARKR